MTTRELPRDEWSRLAGTELENVWPLMETTGARVLVLEEDGKIVACWSLLPVWHLEGIWIDPQVRGRGGIARRLLKVMREWLGEAQIRGVVTSATNAKVKGWLSRLGAIPLIGQSFMWTIPQETKTCQRQ